METPRVSVVITTKDYARFLPQAIESVLRQSLASSHRELIVVDDGSVDDTAAVMKRFEGRVLYIYQENCGQAAALNAGLKVAGGEFVALLDADDYFYETKLEEVLRKFETHGHLGMVHHRLDVVNNEGSMTHTGPFRARLDEGWLGEQLIRYGGTWNAFVSAATSALTFRRSALEEILPIPESDFRTMADGYLVTQMALRRPIGAVHRSLGAYRVHGKNNWTAAALTPELIRLRYLRPLERVSELVQARVPASAAQIHVRQDRTYIEYRCLAEKMEGRFAGALKSFGLLVRALRRDSRIGRSHKLWRLLSMLMMLALPVSSYTRLRQWYTRNHFAYRLRTKLFATK